MSNDVLLSLLLESRKYGGRYGGGLANHLPMALLALSRLGADERRLREFTAFYEQRLRLKALDQPSLPAAGWRTVLGRPDYETALGEMFAHAIADRGMESVLNELLPYLTPGIASAAFHGLIRTAYAVDSGEDADLPNALSYWVVSYSELGPIGAANKFGSVAEAFATMRDDARFAGLPPRRGSIDAAIAAVAHMDTFLDYRAAVPNVDLSQVARIAASIYLATSDFTALHLVTACHATRLLSQYLRPDVLDHLSVAMLAAYAAIGRPVLDLENTRRATLGWSSLAELAIASNDDHDLKLVYSCQQEEETYGWGLHQAAAELRLSHR